MVYTKYNTREQNVYIWCNAIYIQNYVTAVLNYLIVYPCFSSNENVQNSNFCFLLASYLYIITRINGENTRLSTVLHFDLGIYVIARVTCRVIVSTIMFIKIQLENPHVYTQSHLKSNPTCLLTTRVYFLKPQSVINMCTRQMCNDAIVFRNITNLKHTEVVYRTYNDTANNHPGFIHDNTCCYCIVWKHWPDTPEYIRKIGVTCVSNGHVFYMVL